MAAAAAVSRCYCYSSSLPMVRWENEDANKIRKKVRVKMGMERV